MGTIHQFFFVDFKTRSNWKFQPFFFLCQKKLSQKKLFARKKKEKLLLRFPFSLKTHICKKKKSFSSRENVSQLQVIFPWKYRKIFHFPTHIISVGSSKQSGCFVAPLNFLDFLVKKKKKNRIQGRKKSVHKFCLFVHKHFSKGYEKRNWWFSLMRKMQWKKVRNKLE